jgi:hypothetical protein
MFVRDFLHVQRPFQAVAPRFVGSDLQLERIAERAVTRVRDTFEPSGERGDLRCNRGALRSRGEAIVVPLQFVDIAEPNGPGSLEGELQVAPFEEQTELGFEASYHTDADGSGNTRRLTEIAVRTFLQALGRTLED